MSLLTAKQKALIQQGEGDFSVARQLENKSLAEITDEYRDDGYSKKARIRLTPEGERIKRYLDDPTKRHV